MLRCLYIGTDHFSARVLQGVLSSYTDRNGLEKLDVVCPPQKAQKIKGVSFIKPCPVELCARDNKLDVFHYDDVKHKFAQTVCPYDVGVVVSFGYLLPSRLIRWFPRRCINVHPSLLPRYRGAAPIQHTIINGDHISGCTILELSERKYDCGPVLLQHKYRISSAVTSEMLSCELADLGVEMLLEVINNFDHYQKNKQTQNNSQASSAPKISKEMGFVDFKTWTADYCDRVYRAIGREYGVWVQFGTKKVKLVEISYSKDCVITTAPINLPPGTLIYNNQSELFTLHFKQGCITVTKLQVATKRVTTAREFYNGYMTSQQNNSELLLRSINQDISQLMT